MTEQKEFVDFNIGLGDSGEDNLAAIQPLSDGEGATQLQFRRPSENLRERTEVLRDTVGELLYYRDYSHLMIEYTGGTITWNGPAPGASPLGKISVTAGNFILSPMLAPYQAKKGVLNVGTASSNRVIYTVAGTAYATHGMNAVTIKHLDVTGTVSIGVTISDGPVKRIVVTFDSTNSGHDAFAAQTALAAAISSDTDLAGRLVITTSALSNVTIAAVAETRLDTTADDEKHVVSGADIQTLTTTTPLEPGMGVAIWYKYLIEPAGFGADPKGGLAGGRAESSGDRGTSAIPAAALFVTHVSPDKIPGAIPICRVGYNGQLIWYDGTRLEAGESFQFKSPTSVASTALNAFTTSLSQVTGGALVGYNGSDFWADGVTKVTSATVEAAIDEVVADLAAVTATSPGAIRVGVDGANLFATGGTGLTALGGGGALTSNATIRAVLGQLHTSVVARRGFTATCTDGTTSVGGDLNGTDLFTNVNTLGAGKYFIRRGTYTPTVQLSTPSSTAFEGEGSNLVTLSSPINTNLDFTTDTALPLTFKSVLFTTPATSTGRYVLGTGSYRIENCRARTGALGVSCYSTSYIEIDGLEIHTDAGGDHNASLRIQDASGVNIGGRINGLHITAINAFNAATAPQYALHLDNIGGGNFKDVTPLLIENSLIAPATGYGAGSGAVLYIQNCRQELTIRNCLIAASVYGAIQTTLVDIVSSNDVTFENCVFSQDGLGVTLAVDASSNNLTFRNCRFYTSPSNINSDEILVQGNTLGKIVFDNCEIIVRAGNGSTTRRIEFGSLAGVGTGSNIVINNLTVKLSYAGATVNDKLLTIITGNASDAVASVRNLTLDLQGKRLTVSGGRVCLLEGYQGASFDCTGIHLKNITEGDSTTAGFDTCAVVDVGRVRIRGGSVNGTAAGSNVSGWKGIFNISGSGGAVSEVDFWESTAPNLGRCVYGQADRAVITRNKVYIVNLATNANHDGFFCKVEQNQSIVSENTISITGTVGIMSANADDQCLIFLAPTANQCAVSNNVCRTNTHIRHVEIAPPSGANKGVHTIIGNTFRTTHTAQAQVIRIGAASTGNVISGNTAFNTNGSFGASLSDSGTDTVSANLNYFEP